MSALHGQSAVVAVLLVGLMVGALAPVSAAGPSHDAGAPSLLVDLDADGSAAVTLSLTYDLTTDDEHDAFESLSNDADARAEARNRFHDRMARVAADAADATEREMSIEDASVELWRADDGETGVVELRVDWQGFAAVEDDRLIVTEPFASGYAPDRPVVVVGPDGYELAAVTPAASETTADSAMWASGATLDGFEVVFEASDDGESTVSQPGFGALAAILATIALVPFARR